MNLREWLADVYRKAKIEIILMYFLFLEVAYNPKTIQRVKALGGVIRLLKFVFNLPDNGGNYD